MSNVGQGATAIVGGIIGWFVGGPAGAAYGFQLGLLAGTALFPTQLDPVYGPRIEDLQTTSAQVGVPVVQAWGTIALPGTVLWLGPMREVATTEQVGGKGGPEQEVTTYTYHQPIAVGLCEGPVTGILRIWENGKLVYDVRPRQSGETTTEYNERIDASTEYEEGFTFYSGSAEQLPDPTIEAIEGVGNVPGFRDLAYIVYHDWQLQDSQARRHPQRRFEVYRDFDAVSNVTTMQTSNENDIDAWAGYEGWGGAYLGGAKITPAWDADILLQFHDRTQGGNPGDVETSLGVSSYDMRSGELLARKTWAQVLGPNAFTRWMKRGPQMPLSSDQEKFFVSWSTSTDITQPEQGTHYVARIDARTLTAELIRENTTGTYNPGGDVGPVTIGPISQRWDFATTLPVPEGDVLLVYMARQPMRTDGSFGTIGEFSLVDAETLELFTRPLSAIPGDIIIDAQFDSRWDEGYLHAQGLDNNFRPVATVAGNVGVTHTEGYIVWMRGGDDERFLIGKVRIQNNRLNWEFDVIGQLDFSDVFPDSTSPLDGFSGFGREPWDLIDDAPNPSDYLRVLHDPSDDTLVMVLSNEPLVGHHTIQRVLKFDPNAGTEGEIVWSTTLFKGLGSGEGGPSLWSGGALWHSRIVEHELLAVIGPDFPPTVNDEPPLVSINTTTGAVTDLGLAPVGSNRYSAFDPDTRRMATVEWWPGDLSDWLPEISFSAMVDMRRATIASRGTDLATIVRDVCLRVGFEENELDLADIQGIEVAGYARTRVMAARDVIAPLRMIGFFDCVESGNQLRWPTRGKPPVATLSLEDLGAHVEGEDAPAAITTRKMQEIELPRRIRVHYLAPSRDYEPGEQVSPTRLTTSAVNETDLDLVAALDDTQAAQIAEIVWADAWRARWIHETAVDRKWMHLEPADAVLVPVDGRLERMRIATLDDADVVLRRVELVRDDDGSYESAAVATPPLGLPPPRLQRIAATEIVALDLPPLRETDNDAGFFIAANPMDGGSKWDGAVIYRSADAGANWTQVGIINAPGAIRGSVVTAPPVVLHTTWDHTSSIVVELTTSATLSSATEAAVLAGANLAAVGAPGRWELVQFQVAEQDGPTTWILSELLRGRRGTEHHAMLAGDDFVLLSGPGIARIPLETSQVGAPLLYRAVSIGAAFVSAEPETITGEGVALKPFSPVHITGTRDTSGDLTISWIRRDRLHQPLRSGVSLPNSEANEQYSIDILNDEAEVVRTLTTTTPSVVYTADQQSIDFGAPVPPPVEGPGGTEASFDVTPADFAGGVSYFSPVMFPPSGIGSVSNGDLGDGHTLAGFGTMPGGGFFISITGPAAPAADFLTGVEFIDNSGTRVLDPAEASGSTSGSTRTWQWSTAAFTGGNTYPVTLTLAGGGGITGGVAVRIHQLSAVIGRGTPGEAIL